MWRVAVTAVIQYCICCFRILNVLQANKSASLFIWKFHPSNHIVHLGITLTTLQINLATTVKHTAAMSRDIFRIPAAVVRFPFNSHSVWDSLFHNTTADKSVDSLKCLQCKTDSFQQRRLCKYWQKNNRQTLTSKTSVSNSTTTDQHFTSPEWEKYWSIWRYLI